MINDVIEKNLKQLLLVIILVSGVIIGSKFLLNNFYPSDGSSDQIDTVPVGTENVAENTNPVRIEDMEGVSILNGKTNLTLDHIASATYHIAGVPEAVFEDGEFKKGGMYSKITAYSFGDIDRDGNGDAVVATTLYTEGKEISELHVVLNRDNYPKTLEVIPPTGDIEVLAYKQVAIKNGQIVLTLKTAEKDIIKTYILNRTELVEYTKQSVLKVYENKDFKFSFLYPEGLRVESRPIIQDGKTVSETLAVVVNVPFLKTYSMWKEKRFSIFVRPGVCPYRNDAVSISKYNLDVKIYDPDYTVTSNTQNQEKMREYMIYKDRYCYTAVLRVAGPGPLSPDFPQIENPEKPTDLKSFLDSELETLENIFATFGFL